jgi:uncharacterized membrane protein
VPAKAVVRVLLMDSDIDATPRSKGLERLLGLSDDVFAFAITLLVLDLVTPVIIGPASNVSLASAMVLELSSLFNYFVSFWVIGMLWLAHHRIFSHVKYSDTGLLTLNLLFLFFVVLMPFATRILDSYESIQLAVVIYASVLIGASLTNAFIWRYASSGHRLVNKEISQRTVRWLWIRSFVAPAIFAVSIFLAFVNRYLSIACWLTVLPAVLLFDRRFARQISKTR